MQKVNRPQHRWRNVVFGCVALLIIVADQLSKTWIRTNLVRGQSIFDIGFFQIVNVQNTGAIFGIFKDHSQTLIVVAIVGIIGFLLLVFVLRRRWPFLNSMWVVSAIGLVMGGMVGNLIDRLRMGHVTDFIDFKVWPVFNIADSAITIGCILIAYRVICLAVAEEHRE